MSKTLVALSDVTDLLPDISSQSCVSTYPCILPVETWRTGAAPSLETKEPHRGRPQGGKYKSPEVEDPHL
jgi:hypothetical protein